MDSKTNMGAFQEIKEISHLSIEQQKVIAAVLSYPKGAIRFDIARKSGLSMLRVCSHVNNLIRDGLLVSVLTLNISRNREGVSVIKLAPDFFINFCAPKEKAVQ